MPLVQLALRAKDDRDRAAPGRLWQTALAREEDLHGSPRIRGNRERRGDLNPFSAHHADLSCDGRSFPTRLAQHHLPLVE
jgi:hypothetical protein